MKFTGKIMKCERCSRIISYDEIFTNPVGICYGGKIYTRPFGVCYDCFDDEVAVYHGMKKCLSCDEMLPREDYRVDDDEYCMECFGYDDVSE